MRTVWQNQEKYQSYFKNGWYISGDKARIDEDGYFWFCGRADDMLKVSGLWVSPLEIETVLMEHPAVYECAVVARTDSDGLDKARAVVVLKPGYDESNLPEIEDLIRGKLPRYKVLQFLRRRSNSDERRRARKQHSLDDELRICGL